MHIDLGMYQCQIGHDSFKELLKGKHVTWQVMWECQIQEGAWKASKKCRNLRHPDFYLCTIGGCTQAARQLTGQIPACLKVQRCWSNRPCCGFIEEFLQPQRRLGCCMQRLPPPRNTLRPFAESSKGRREESCLRLLLPSPCTSSLESAPELGQQSSHCWAWGSGAAYTTHLNRATWAIQ